jgi:hypothetical protein
MNDPQQAFIGEDKKVEKRANLFVKAELILLYFKV